MKCRRILLMIALVCIGFSVQPAYAISNITIMSDDNMSLAVSKLAREYARLQHVGVATSFLPKDQQSAQILEGSAVDVLITSDSKWLNELQMRGLLDIYSKQECAHGRLALVGPAGSNVVMALKKNASTAPLIQAMGYEPMLYIGNPEEIADGKYAKQALRNLEMSDALEPYILYLKSMDEIIAQVTEHERYSVMSYSRALLLEDARIIDVFPADSHSPIVYYAVVIAGDHMDEARQFIRFLSTPTARHLINSSGFFAKAGE